MRRFSLTATFNQMAGQLPPPLPGPPFPVPDLVPVKRSLKRHSIANGTEHAAIARQVINTTVIVKPQIPDIFTRTTVEVSSSAPSGPESPSTATIDYLVSPPKAPPTIAESVTGSEFESVYNANWHLEHESLKLRDCVKSDTSGTRHSQESLLSELVKQQSTDSGTQNGPTLVQAEAARDGSECLTEPKTSACPKSTQSKKPTLLKSVVIPASLKVADNPSHISLSIQNGEPSIEEKSRQSRKQRWSVVEQPPKNRVSQVASAWEQYFNPFCRVKRSHSTGTQPNQPKQQKKSSLSQMTRSCVGSQPNSEPPGLLRSTHQKIECASPQTGFKEPTTVQKHRQSCSNITLSDSSISESMYKSWTNSVAKLSKTSKEKYAKSSVSTSTQLHSTEPISSTFSSISSVDAFVLLPVRDLVEAYVRCNGSAAMKQIDNSQKHGSAHSSDSTVNQAQLVAGSLLSFSDSIAQMSQTSSSTITVSGANIAAQEKTSQQQLTENLSPPPNRRICSPIWFMSRSTMCELDPRSELEETKLHPRPTSFRSRSVSTPNYPHRPLSVTVTRHQVRVTASSSKSSSTDSARHASPLVLARHRISQPQTKTKLQSQSQPQPTHQPGSVSNGHTASAIGCHDLNTQGEPKKLTSVGTLNQSDRRIFGVTLQPHGTVVLNRNESGNHELVGRRRRITLSQFPRWPEPLTHSAQTAVPTTYLSTRLDAAHVISEPTSEVKPSEVCTTTRCSIDQSRIENTRSKSRSTEKRTRSLSATSVPSHSLSNSNSPTGSHPYTFIANAMDLSEQTRSLNEVQPFRGMRSRGIYKRNIGDRLSSGSCRGGVNSRHDPRVHCGVDSNTRSTGQRTNEPVTEKTSALSPASQRYEQHIQAQRLNPNEVHGVWRSNVNWYGRDLHLPDPIEECITPVKQTEILMSLPYRINEQQIFEPLDPPTDRYNQHHRYCEAQRSLQSESHQKEQEGFQSAEPTRAKDLNDDMVDPEIWRDKLGLITRWQREVNTAMQAGETDVDLLLRSPPVTPSTQRNYSWAQLFNEFAAESERLRGTDREEPNGEEHLPVAEFCYQPHELTLSSQVPVQRKSGLQYCDDAKQVVDHCPVPTEYDNAPVNEPPRSKGYSVEPSIPKYKVERNLSSFNDVPSSMETKVSFDPNYPVSFSCAPSADRRDSLRGVLPAPLLSDPPVQETAAQTEMKPTREVSYITAPSSTVVGQGKPFTLDQALDGSVDSPTPRRALPTIAPLPPLAQTRCSKSNSNPIPLDPVRITSPIVPAKQASVKQASIAGPHVSFDCKPTGALGPKIELKDYENLGAFPHNTGSNVPTVRTNNYNPITTATAPGNFKATNSNNSHGTASDANDTESAKPRSFSQISFSPSYNDALNLHSTPRTDGWTPNESTSKTKPALGVVTTKTELQGILRTSNPIPSSVPTTGAILVPQTSAHGLVRAKFSTGDPYPIYEGLDNLDLILTERSATTQWTRVPAANKRNSAVVPAPAVPPHVFQSSPLNRVDDAGTELNRCRSAARVQLATSQSATNGTPSIGTDAQNGLVRETAISSGLQSHANSGLNTLNETSSRQKTAAFDNGGHGGYRVRLRPSLRRAATISPVRQYRAYQEEVSDLPDLETQQQPAMSSGFVSAGSIVVAPDDGSEGVNKSGISVTMKGKTSDFHGLPPPVDVHSYPFVFDLQRGLDKLNQCTVNSSVDPGSNKHPAGSGSEKVSQSEIQTTYMSGPIQTPTSSKFLLGRVASNEDICIETEAPFVFTIAATDKEICITKVASVDDLKGVSSSDKPETGRLQKQQQQQRKSSQPSRRTVPVNLRLTFGSESNLVGCDRSRKPDALPPGTSYRVMYHVDIPYGSNVAQFKRDALRRVHSTGGKNPFRYSLPCISYREDEPKPIALLS